MEYQSLVLSLACQCHRKKTLFMKYITILTATLLYHLNNMILFYPSSTISKTLLLEVIWILTFPKLLHIFWHQIHYLDSIFIDSFVRTLTRPMQITHKSATLIINILVKSNNNTIRAHYGIIPVSTNISDHFSNFFTFILIHMKQPNWSLGNQLHLNIESLQTIQHISSTTEHYWTGNI